MNKKSTKAKRQPVARKVKPVVGRIRRELWNKCQVCGRIIPYADFESGAAINDMATPDSDLSSESWDTRCRKHYTPNPSHHAEAGLAADSVDGVVGSLNQDGAK